MNCKSCVPLPHISCFPFLDCHSMVYKPENTKRST